MIEHFRNFLTEARRHTSHLVILGDLFDYWIGPYSFHKEDFSVVFKSLYNAHRHGLNLSFVAGNRDFLARHDLKRQIPIETYRDRWTFHSENTTWIGVHGDTLCHQDTSYQFYRRLIQTDLIGCSVQMLPAFLKTQLIRDLRSISRNKIKGMSGRRRTLSRYRIRSLLQSEAEHLICGHVHDPGHYSLSAGNKQRNVWVLGDWIDTDDCTFFIGRDDHSELVQF